MKTLKTLDAFMDKLPAERRAKIEARTEQTIAAIRLAHLRKQQHMTQKQLAEKMQLSQANISQIENQGDMQLSTLMRYVNALGGNLDIQVVMADGSRVPLGSRGQT